MKLAEWFEAIVEREEYPALQAAAKKLADAARAYQREFEQLDDPDQRMKAAYNACDTLLRNSLFP